MACSEYIGRGRVMSKVARYQLYILELQGDRKYVGITTNLKRRYSQHVRGKGANYTAKHPPIRIISTKDLGYITLEEAEKYEDAKVLEYMLKQGMERVRGGHFFYPSIGGKKLRRKYSEIDDTYKNIRMDRDTTLKDKPAYIRKKKKYDAMWQKEIKKAKYQLNMNTRRFAV